MPNFCLSLRQKRGNMNLTIFNERENTIQKIKFGGSKVAELLQQLKLNQEAFLVVRNNEVITEEEILNDKDKIELLSVVSGG